MHQGENGENIIVHLKKIELIGVKPIKTEHVKNNDTDEG
jgi:hypothetical protein